MDIKIVATIVWYTFDRTNPSNYKKKTLVCQLKNETKNSGSISTQV